MVKSLYHAAMANSSLLEFRGNVDAMLHHTLGQHWHTVSNLTNIVF